MLEMFIETYGPWAFGVAATVVIVLVVSRVMLNLWEKMFKPLMEATSAQTANLATAAIRYEKAAHVNQETATVLFAVSERLHQTVKSAKELHSQIETSSPRTQKP